VRLGLNRLSAQSGHLWVSSACMQGGAGAIWVGSSASMMTPNGPSRQPSRPPSPCDRRFTLATTHAERAADQRDDRRVKEERIGVGGNGLNLSRAAAMRDGLTRCRQPPPHSLTPSSQGAGSPHQQSSRSCYEKRVTESVTDWTRQTPVNRGEEAAASDNPSLNYNNLLEIGSRCPCLWIRRVLVPAQEGQ
jgi:hypothetical protein